jgi:hypothetical protein
MRPAAAVGLDGVTKEPEHLGEVVVHRFLQVPMAPCAEHSRAGFMLGPGSEDGGVVGARCQPYSTGGHTFRRVVDDHTESRQVASDLAGEFVLGGVRRLLSSRQEQIAERIGGQGIQLVEGTSAVIVDRAPDSVIGVFLSHGLRASSRTDAHTVFVAALMSDECLARRGGRDKSRSPSPEATLFGFGTVLTVRTRTRRRRCTAARPWRRPAGRRADLSSCRCRRGRCSRRRG